MSEDQLYSQARLELENKRVVQSLWAQARIKAGEDDPNKIAVHYIALRVAQLRKKAAKKAGGDERDTAVASGQNPTPDASVSEAVAAPADEMADADAGGTTEDAAAADSMAEDDAGDKVAAENRPVEAAGEKIPPKNPAASADAKAASLPSMDQLFSRWHSLPRQQQLIAAAAVAAVLVVLALLWFWPSGKQTEPPREAETVVAPPVVETGPQETMMFRGNPARTGVFETSGPVRFNELVWSFKSDEEITAAPVVTKDAVYFGANDGSLYAINRRNGQELWRFASGDAIVSSPAVLGSLLYVTSLDGHLYALTRTDGQEKWRLKTEGAIFASPAVADGVVYVGSQNSQLYAVDSATGRVNWQAQIGSGGIDASPAVYGDTLYIGSLDGHLYAVDRESGNVNWQFETDGAIAATPAVTGRAVYVGSTGGHFYAIDRLSGQNLWRLQTEEIIVAGAAVVDASETGSAAENQSALPAEANVADGSADQEAAALSDDAELAQSELETGDGLVVYFLTIDGTLHAIDENGLLLWDLPVDSRIFTAPAVAGNSVYFGTSDGHIYAIDRMRGTTQWRAMFSNSPLSSPAVADGVLYLGSADTRLYAVK